MAGFSIVNYVKGSYDELIHKVTWPSWSELQSSTLVVGVATLIIALMVYILDISFRTLMEAVYGLFV
jgi:preprotein translocase subunit SecE